MVDKKRIGKILDKVSKLKISKKRQKKTKVRGILKKSQTVAEIKEHKPAEYVGRFFKDELEETKNAMFFK